jgi:uncharacterized protein
VDDPLGRQEKARPFWQTKSLEELDAGEWESLCDGCGRCCLLKLEDDETGQLHHTRLACRLLDIGSCRCLDYDNRNIKVSDCIRIDPETVRSLRWLPPTCGYRLVAEGKDLMWWHPLISGDPDTVHTAGVSVRGLARSEVGVRERDIERYIITTELLGNGASSKKASKEAPPRQPRANRKAKT